MAMPKKGSRIIHVNGGDYRWVVSPDDGYMVLVVEAATAPRRRLLVRTDYRDARIPNARTGGYSSNPQMRITPGFVRRCIEGALESDWDPSTPGRDVELIHHEDDSLTLRA
jgi:hypothetical protein